MSVKIYNGYRLPSDVNVANIFDWVSNQQKWISPMRHEIIDSYLFRVARSSFDIRYLTALGLARSTQETTAFQSALESAKEGLVDLQANRRVPGLDVEVSLRVFFRPNRPQNLYATLFSENREITRLFNLIPGMKEFSYWDNTDPPEDMAEDSFNRRGNIWNALCNWDSDQEPKGASLLFTLSPVTCQLDLDNSRLLNPGFIIPEAWHGNNFEDRTMTAAISSIPPSELPQNVQDDLNQRASFSSYMAFNRMLRDGKDPAFNEKLAKVRDLLPEHVQLPWLFMNNDELLHLSQKLGRPRRRPGP